MSRHPRPHIRRIPGPRSFGVAAALALLSMTAPAGADVLDAPGKHVHGEVTLNIALEGRKLLLEIEAPADQALGFERSPRDDLERAAVKAVDEWFRSGRSMLGVPRAAGCRLVEAKFTPPKLGSGHADYNGRYLFDCASPEALEWVEVWALRRLQGVEEAVVNLITPAGQRQETLRDRAARISLR
ncbi:MAG: DUF2796 domain-containing protein [Gammaproteobacteria bacterium]|nr:DUF2796 domain-containing protein [Gammaproteobacteria bacterium]